MTTPTPSPSAAEPQLCEHLAPVLAGLLASGARITFAGQAWSDNCRLWVYLDRPLDLPALRAQHALPTFIADHEHRGTHEGSERGLVCTRCRDAIMGPLPQT